MWHMQHMLRNPEGLCAYCLYAIQGIKKRQMKAKEGQGPTVLINHCGHKWSSRVTEACIAQPAASRIPGATWWCKSSPSQDANLQWSHVKRAGIEIPKLVPKRAFFCM